MRHKPRLRLFAGALALILTAILGVFGHQSWAAAQINIYTNSGSTQCGSGTTRASYQDSWVGIELGQFDAFDPVLIDLTFPDGRIYTIETVPYLDGVADQIVSQQIAFGTDSGGATHRLFWVNNDLPYGCYRLTARGLQSGKTAIGNLAVVARPYVPPPRGPATLRIEDRTTGAITGQHGAAVNIIGSGFLAQERVYIWLTAPDGAVLDFPEQFASPQFITNNNGEFVATFEFASYNPVGEYKFTAQGSTGERLMAIAPFTLTSRPTNPQGWAALRVAFPFDGSNGQRGQFEIQGDRFGPLERIDIWITLPDGAVRGLPSQFADQFGSFFVVLSTDEQLPRGTYAMTAKGAITGAIVITRFDLETNSGTAVNTNLEPAIVDSNNGPVTNGNAEFDTRTEGNVGAIGAQESPGPICDATNNWCK
jgi:hypothetical protein